MLENQSSAILNYATVFRRPVIATTYHHSDEALTRYILDNSFIDIKGRNIFGTARNPDVETAVATIKIYTERIQDLIKINRPAIMMRTGYSILFNLYHRCTKERIRLTNIVDRQIIDELQSYEAGLGELVRKVGYLDKSFFKRELVNKNDPTLLLILETAESEAVRISRYSSNPERNKKHYTQLLAYALARSLTRKAVVLSNNKRIASSLTNMHGLIILKKPDIFKGGLELVMDT